MGRLLAPSEFLSSVCPKKPLETWLSRKRPNIPYTTAKSSTIRGVIQRLIALPITPTGCGEYVRIVTLFGTPAGRPLSGLGIRTRNYLALLGRWEQLEI